MADPRRTVRDRVFTDFSSVPPETIRGHRRWLARAQNFWVEWIELCATSGCDVASEDEMLLIAPSYALSIAPAGAPAVEAPAHSVTILPPGSYTITGPASARCALLASDRSDAADRRVLGAQAYTAPDPRVRPAGKPYRRKHRTGIEVLDIAAVMASRDKPRLKMLQTETLSINIVEYAGPRNRAELSPHSHDSFEQGSLAVAGSFVHHLRTPWGSDADQWRDDEHLQAPSPSLLVVPVEMVHTTEGVGQEHHFLVDIFCPPRDDFIAKGWVFNAPDYEQHSPILKETVR